MTSSCLRTSRSSPAQTPHHTRPASQQAPGNPTPTHPRQQQQSVRLTRTSSSNSLVVLQMVTSSLPHHPAVVGSQLPSRPAGGHTTAACLGATAAAVARRSPSRRQGRLLPLVADQLIVCASACCFAPLSLPLDHHPAGRPTAQGASSSAAPSQ